MNPDPWFRRPLERVPVPAGLEARIRATVARRRAGRRAALAAAALLVALTVALWPRPSWPSPKPLEISLREPVPEPIRLNESSIGTEVESDGHALVLHFSE